MRYTVIATLATLIGSVPVRAADAELTPIHQEAVKYLDGMRSELVEVNQDIWAYAELGLEEHRSAARLIGLLKKGGFKIKEGVSNMPTAFVAEYGSGKPVIG